MVSMFRYTCDTSEEGITWQEEELARGDYVPYGIVQLAGDISIARYGGGCLAKKWLQQGQRCFK